MPTGTGKTVVALAAMQRARVATLVVAPMRDLMCQWHRRILQDLGYDAGIIGDSHYCLRPISVTTYDSAYNGTAPLKHADVDFVAFFALLSVPSTSMAYSPHRGAMPRQIVVRAFFGRALLPNFPYAIEKYRPTQR